MHKNTVLLIIALTVIASILIGINIGKRLNPSSNIFPSPSPIVVISSPFPTPTQVPVPTTYDLTDCGISFQYESNFLLTEASRGAQLTNKQSEEQINIGCSEKIPRPPLTKDKIEVATVAGLKVNLYHDASAKDGAPLDAVIFTNPQNNLDVAILGFGEAFNQLLTTLRLLQ